MESQLLLLLGLIIISGAFSSAEIALTSLSNSKVQTLEEDKRWGSQAVFKLKKKPQAMLITILIGNNLVNIYITVLSSFWGAQLFQSNAAGIVTGILTVVILIFGEIIPKTIGQKYAEGVSRVFATPLLGLTYILSPLIWFLDKFIHLLMKLLNAKNPIQSMSEEELLAMVDIGTQEGIIEEDEQELIENVLEFNDTVVEEIMTIRENMEMMEASTTVREAAHFFVEHTHSRIPVYDKNPNNIIGIITVHDILNLSHQSKNPESKTLRELHFNPAVIVPKTKAINKLFRELKFARKHMAIVVDEWGKTIGLVTLEDIIEEIVGDIADEEDEDTKNIHKLENRKWEANAEATIEELNKVLKMDLEYPVHQTISLLILEKLQGFPTEGQSVTHENLLFEVKRMGKTKIEKVHITKMQKESNEEDDED